MFKTSVIYIFLFICCIGCKSNQDGKDLVIYKEVYDFPVPEDDASIVELNNYATAQWAKDNYQEALRYFSIAYQKAKAQNNETEIANILNNLGLVHWRLGDNISAMDCYKESYQLAEKLNLKRLAGLSLTNQALIQKEEEKFEEALINNEKAIKIFQELNLSRDLAIAYNNQGQIFKNQSENELALQNYSKAISIYNTIDYKDGMSATYYNLAEIYTRTGNKEKAVSSAIKSLNLGLNSESKVRISEAYRKLGETYEHFHEADSALKYQKKYAEFEKQILIANQSEKLIEEQAKLGNEVKLLRIENLEKEKTIVRNKMLMIISGILIIVLIASLLIYRRISTIRINKKRLEFELENSNRILQIKKKELKNYIVDLTQKNQLISQLQNELNNENSQQESQVAQLLNQKILTDEDWEKFKSKFQTIYPNFLPKIKLLKSVITEAEIRFLVLLRLKLSAKEMANTLGISPQSVRVTKMRLKKKLQEESFDSVEDFLAEL